MRLQIILLKGYVVFSLLLGVLAGAATTYMALDHNPQQVYCDYVPKGQSGQTLDHGECNIVFGNLAPLVILNAVVVSIVFLSPVLLYLVVAVPLRRLRRRMSAQAADKAGLPSSSWE